MSVNNQRDASSSSARNKAGGVPGASVTSNASSGCDNPLPMALMYASLRVQHLKNAATCSSFGNALNASTSACEKKRRAMSSVAKSARMCSTSTPSSASTVTASSATSFECDRLNRKLCSLASAGLPYAPYENLNASACVSR